VRETWEAIEGERTRERERERERWKDTPARTSLRGMHLTTINHERLFAMVHHVMAIATTQLNTQGSLG
jgi:hypothetical protein